MSGVSSSLEGVRGQLAEQQALLDDLEAQQAVVSSISNFIVVETDDSTCLEDELGALGERWCMLCR